MNLPLRSQAVTLALAVACCCAPAVAAPWFVGEFRGAKPQNPADPQMTVTCRSGERCAVLAAHDGKGPVPVNISIQEHPKPIDTEIPNNNWEATAKAASSRPEWYKDPSFGPMLAPLRPILQTQSRFAQCVDLDGTGYLTLCSLTTDPEGAQSVMLLLITMNGSCGDIPFCAYYFMPLERVSGR